MIYNEDHTAWGWNAPAWWERSKLGTLEEHSRLGTRAGTAFGGRPRTNKPN